VAGSETFVQLRGSMSLAPRMVSQVGRPPPCVDARLRGIRIARPFTSREDAVATAAAMLIIIIVRTPCVRPHRMPPIFLAHRCCSSAIRTAPCAKGWILVRRRYTCAHLHHARGDLVGGGQLLVGRRVRTATRPMDRHSALCPDADQFPIGHTNRPMTRMS
jgi:hypothetical protein